VPTIRVTLNHAHGLHQLTKEAEFELHASELSDRNIRSEVDREIVCPELRIGAVLTEMYTHAEHLQKKHEVKNQTVQHQLCTNCCTGVLEANLNSNVIGVAHIGMDLQRPSR